MDFFVWRGARRPHSGLYATTSNEARRKKTHFYVLLIMAHYTSKGMVIVGSWIDEKEDDHYIWMRRFDSEAERERLYKLVYEDPHWTNDIKPQIDEMLDRSKIIVTRLVATPRSVMS